MFVPGAASASFRLALRGRVRWAIAVGAVSVFLANRGGGWVAVVAVMAVVGAGTLVGVSVCQQLANPRTWQDGPVCRGTNLAHCALSIDVSAGQENEALALAERLRKHDIFSTFFVAATVTNRELLVSKLEAMGHEAGTLDATLASESLFRGHTPWLHRRLARSGKRGIGWSIYLRPNSTLDQAERVVSTDIVRIDASVPVATLDAWLANWERRAVRAANVSACSPSPSTMPPHAPAGATRLR